MTSEHSCAAQVLCDRCSKTTARRIESVKLHNAEISRERHDDSSLVTNQLHSSEEEWWAHTRCKSLVGHPQVTGSKPVGAILFVEFFLFATVERLNGRT